MNCTHILTKSFARAATLAGCLGLASVAAAQAPNSLSETYDAWTIQCQAVASPDGLSRQCQMSQELRQKETGQRVMMMAMTMSPDQATNVTIIAPFGLKLSGGIRIAIGEEQMVESGFNTCLPVGCVARMPLEQAALDRFRLEQSLRVMTVSENGRPLQTPMSLMGFSAAHDRLAQLAQE